MAIKLSDCPPALYDAIMRQLEREGKMLPVTTIKYAVAHYVWQTKEWKVGPETSNLKLVNKMVTNQLLRTGASAHMAELGMPMAVAIQLTRTTPATHPKE